MRILSLLNELGDEKIQLQNIQRDATDLKVRMTDGLVTFATAKEHVQDLIQCSLTGKKPNMVALVLWIPGDESRTITDRLTKEESK